MPSFPSVLSLPRGSFVQQPKLDNLVKKVSVLLVMHPGLFSREFLIESASTFPTFIDK